MRWIDPSGILRLLTEITEHYHGHILEILRLAKVRSMKCKMNRAKPFCARWKRSQCASTWGGMFVFSARLATKHKQNPRAELSIHGVEKTDETSRLCRISLAVYGFEADTRL